MNDHPVTPGARSGDPHLRLRLAALIAVIVGVVLVAAAAFLFSYAGLHEIALQAGVPPRLARLYPLMFDAMLVVTCAAVLALRNAGWGTKLYVWTCLLLVLAAVAVGDALHATGVQLTGQAARAAIAVIPWVLLLMGFGIWLVMLRQWRRARAAAAASAVESNQAGPGRTAIEAPAAPAAATALVATAPPAADADVGAVTWAASRGLAPARPGNPGGGIDTLLQRDAGRAPDRAVAAEAAAAAKQAPVRDGQRQRAVEPGQDQPAAATAGAAAAGTGAAGSRQNGATATKATATGAISPSQEGGRKDDGGDQGGRTRLGGLLKAPDSTPDEEESVRVLPAEPKVPTEGADSGKRSQATAKSAQAGDAARNGDAAQAGDTARNRDAQAGDAARNGDAAQAGDGVLNADAAGDGDAVHDGPASPPVPAAALAPHFDRLRSSPTPPDETGTSGA